MNIETQPLESLSVFVHESISVVDVIIIVFRIKWSNNGKGLAFEAFKVSLGTTASEFSGDEIEQLRLAFDRIADIAFDRFVAERNTT